MKKLSCLALILGVVPAASAGTLDGRWDASVSIKGTEIPFRIDFEGDGSSFRGSLYNGDQQVTSTSGNLRDGSAEVNFDHFLGKLKAHRKGDQLEGKFEQNVRDFNLSYEFRAKRHVEATTKSVGNVPSIDGIWTIPVNSPKGEKAWRFIVRQKGTDVSAAILRVDGDTGGLSGTYQDGQFVLSHFSGSRVLLVHARPAKDGSLDLTFGGPFASYATPDSGNKLTAWREDVARAKGLPEPADFVKHTSVKDPQEPFRWSFPDIDGKTISSTDERFKGKVVVAVVTGTWCPNCHDEAQYLVQLYKKYRDKGLEVVALNFEEPEQQEDNYRRVRAFLKKYGVDYTYVIAGSPVEMWEKVPQAVNLNSWPTTFFVGRDGLVKKIHAGFAAPASGKFHDQLKNEFTSTIEELLVQQIRTSAR